MSISLLDPRILIPALLVLALSCVPAYAQPSRTYNLDIDGKQIGQMSMTSAKLSDGGQKLTLTTRIKTSGFWSKVDIKNTLVETISAKGVLQNATNKLTENKKTYWTKIEQSEGEYLAFYAEMKNREQIEEEELVGIAQELVAAVVPVAGDAMTIAGVLFADEKDAHKHRRLKTNSFDTTLIGLPMYWQRNGYAFPASLRIIDTEDMIVFTAKVEDLGTKSVSTSNGPVQSRHYKMKADQGEPIDIWLTKTASGTPYFVQLSGKEDGSAFKVTLNSLQ